MILRYILLTFSALLSSGVCFAETADGITYRDVTVTAAGTLAGVLGTDANTIDSLVVRGPINDSDFNTLWGASFHGRLTVANLEHAEVEGGTVPARAFWHPDEQNSPEGGLTTSIPLRRVILPEGVVGIGDEAFYGATRLKTVDLPGSLRSLGRKAFAFCLKLTASPMGIPEGVASIPDSCFHYCSLVGGVVLPSTVREIGEDAFSWSGIARINFPEGLESIGNEAFVNTKLEEVVLPASCTEFVGERQFGANFQLRRLELQGSVKAIPARFALECVKLEKFAVPPTVEEIGKYALAQCRELTSVSLPEGLRVIDDGALYCCTSLEELTLPSTLTYLGDASCQVLYSLKALHSKAAIPPVCGGTSLDVDNHPFFSGSNPPTNPTNGSVYDYATPSDLPVYVPKGSAELYRKAWGWSYFTNYIEEGESGIPGVSVDGEGAEGEVYDLSGRKVSHPVPGQVYIRQGKKVVYQ